MAYYRARLKDAETALDAALKEHKVLAALHQYQAIVHLHVDESGADSDDVVAASEILVNFCNKEGMIAINAGDMTLATELMNAAMSEVQHPRNRLPLTLRAATHNTYAFLARKAKRYRAAVKHLQDAIAIEEASGDPRDVAASYLNLSACLSAMDNHKQALKEATTAQQLLKADIDAFFGGQATTVEAVGGPARAQTLVGVFFNLGVQQEHLHQWPQAIDAYEKAERLAKGLIPSDPIAQQVETTLAAARTKEANEKPRKAKSKPSLPRAAKIGASSGPAAPPTAAQRIYSNRVRLDELKTRKQNFKEEHAQPMHTMTRAQETYGGGTARRTGPGNMTARSGAHTERSEPVEERQSVAYDPRNLKPWKFPRYGGPKQPLDSTATTKRKTSPKRQRSRDPWEDDYNRNPLGASSKDASGDGGGKSSDPASPPPARRAAHREKKNGTADSVAAASAGDASGARKPTATELDSPAAGSGAGGADGDDSDKDSLLDAMDSFLANNQSKGSGKKSPRGKKSSAPSTPKAATKDKDKPNDSFDLSASPGMSSPGKSDKSRDTGADSPTFSEDFDV